MKKYLVTLLTSFGLLEISVPVFSQKKGAALIDSLQAEVNSQKDDTNRVITLGKLCSAWYLMDIRRAFAPANEALQLAEKLHWTKGIANSENNLGLLMSDTGNQSGARQHYERSYALNVALGSKLYQANTLLNISRTYAFESDFPKAIDYAFRALNLAEAIQNEQKMALIGNNLSTYYSKENNFQKGIEYARYTVAHAKKAGDPVSMRKGLSFMGDAQLALKDTAAAIRSLDSAIGVCRAYDLRVDLAEALADRASAESSLESRIRGQAEAERMMNEVNPNAAYHLAVMAELGLGYLQLSKQKSAGPERRELIKKASDYLDRARAMAEARNNPARLAEVLRSCVELEEYEGRYALALADHKRMVAINDSLFSQDNKNKIAGLETRRAVEMKDAELKLRDIKLSHQRRTTLGLVAGIGMLAIFGILLYRQSRSRKIANINLVKANKALDEANRLKARFFGILSHDLRGPVASLLHFLDIQKHAPDLMNEEQQERHRREIAQSAEGLLHTMEGMLLWSKQQMEIFRPTMRPTRISDLFVHVEAYIGASNSGIVAFQPVGDLSVYTDENYLRVIMQNLTSNAIKATGADREGKVEWRVNKAGDKILLSIVDTGTGFPAARARVLAEEVLSENAHDGFGLHIIRDLAKAIDCRIEVRSETGKGTEILLELPAA